MNVQIAKCASFKTIPALPRRQLNHSDISTPIYLLSQKTSHNFWHATSFTIAIQKITAAYFLTHGVYKLIIMLIAVRQTGHVPGFCISMSAHGRQIDACPHGTKAMLSRCRVKQTIHFSSAELFTTLPRLLAISVYSIMINKASTQMLKTSTY